MKYKRFYLWGSVSLVTIFALIAPFIEYYYNYEDTVYCTDKCFVEFCLKNGNKNLYFYNKNELPLTFKPEGKVNNVRFFKKDGRYKSGYREINFIDPYYKGLYVFKIPAYQTSCYAMEIEKEWYADLKWAFGNLDPMLLSGTQIGDKIVKELCEPIFESIVNTTIYYKTIKGVAYPNGTIVKDKQIIDYTESKIIGQTQVDCIKTGDINVSGEIIGGDNAFCKLEGTKACCYSNKEGGKYAAAWRTDGSVDKECKDLITEEIELVSSTGRRFIK